MKYKEEIMNRPKKEWIQSKFDKERINNLIKKDLGIEDDEEK